MATILRGAAANVINKGPPSSFYDSPGKPNPVFQALDQEIKSYNAYMKKRSLQGYIPQQDEAHSRPADTLFDLWNKYEPRLPSLYYEEKLLEMGDNLVALKEYNLALWQCYVRYLKRFGDVNVEEIVDVEKFKETYFPDGFEMENAGLTFRALMGKSICQYQVIRLSDPKLQNKESIDDSIRLLSFLRLVTQVVLPQEKLCWLVFNGTVHIYSVSRHLMSLGHSSKVLEYLLWACMCMETSVPLLAVHYLQWRSTLYTAVCQCYFDCKQGQHAEAFARRGLSKINELSQLECVSSSKEDVNTELSFRQATIRMAVMMFKRSAFETRKKPKGILRPKQRANLKDAQGLPWPRTPSEKMLAEMFEGSASQFLCIIETLTDSNRRTLVTSPPAPDSEVEILDVFAELFLAAQEILAGGGGNTQQTVIQQGNSINTNRLSAVIEGRSLIQMATQGEDGVPIGAVVKLIKLAYCYEHWELYDVIIDPVLYQLKEIGEEKYGPDIKALELILAMEKVNPNRKHCKRIVQDDSNFVEKEPKTAGIESYEKDDKQGSIKSQPLGDDLLNLGEVLLSITNGPYSQELIDMDMMMDAVLFLWNKCKAVFQKYQTGSIDNTRFLQRMENPSKWVSILHTVHQVLGWCEMNIIDPALTAEVALRLALVIESSALDKGKKKGRRTVPEVDFEEDTARDAAASISGQNINITILNRTELELLVEARDILELGLFNVSIAREATALTDGKSIADIEWVQDLNADLFKPMTDDDESHENLDNLDLAAQNERLKQSDATAVWNTVKDLHLELIFIYHRVCLKLSQLGEDSNSKKHTQLKRRKRPQVRTIL
ncbi:cilia- and flagella-associated protein 54-like [Tubulanus polymorphus]|uniref:cilia- and flagella-associated protein 54-like n=1 Tax=Tubulanus polymorphus TaxID=672921 RepID=UPI003DA6B2C7